MSQNSRLDGGSSIHVLPTELLLEIIPSIPFDPLTLSSLSLTCRKFQSVVAHHEQILVDDIRHCQFGATALAFFPSFRIHSYRTLATMHRRLAALDSLHSQWLRITSHSPELDWLAGRWEGIHKAGLLLLYRLQDVGAGAGGAAARADLLRRLPATSLACLFFKLISSIRILRISGPDPIRSTYAAGDVMARSEIELAFEEMLLQYGPDFFLAMLKVGDREGSRSEWAVRALEAEIAGMLERQSPSPDGVPKPATLISQLRRAFAARVGCEMVDNMNKMWELLSSTSFDDVNDAKLVQIIQGEELTGGMKRMGF